MNKLRITIIALLSITQLGLASRINHSIEEIRQGSGSKIEKIAEKIILHVDGIAL